MHFAHSYCAFIRACCTAYRMLACCVCMSCWHFVRAVCCAYLMTYSAYIMAYCAWTLAFCMNSGILCMSTDMWMNTVVMNIGMLCMHFGIVGSMLYRHVRNIMQVKFWPCCTAYCMLACCVCMSCWHFVRAVCCAYMMTYCAYIMAYCAWTLAFCMNSYILCMSTDVHEQLWWTLACCACMLA